MKLLYSDPFVTAFLFFFCIKASYTDLRRMRIADDVNFFAIISGIGFHAVCIKNVNALFGALVGFALLLIPAVIIGAQMGGDIKFCAGLGAWIGASNLLPVLIAAIIIFTLYAILTHHKAKDAIPFAPFLSCGVGLCMVFAAYMMRDMNIFMAGATIPILVAFMSARILSNQNLNVERRVCLW